MHLFSDTLLELAASTDCDSADNFLCAYEAGTPDMMTHAQNFVSWLVVHGIVTPDDRDRLLGLTGVSDNPLVDELDEAEHAIEELPENSNDTEIPVDEGMNDDEE